MPEVILNGAKIYYQDHGSGFPVILTHGLGGDHSMWVNQVQAFKEKYRVVLWDCRGHGKSEVTEDGYSIEQFVDDLRALLRHLKIDRAHIAGLSMGGWISWSFAIAHPDITASLVLSDSAGMITGFDPKKLEEKSDMFNASAHIAEQYGREKLADPTISMMFSEEFIKNQPEIIALVRQRIINDPGIGYARTIKNIFATYWQTTGEEIKKKLAQIKAPTIVLGGDVDQLTPLPTQKALHESITGSRFEIISGSGHVPPVEKPAIWNKLVLEFLEDIDV